MERPTPSRLLVSALTLACLDVSAQESVPSTASEGRRVTASDAVRSEGGEVDPLGAVVAPATLPDGTTALYGYVGAPELGVGFRQGISGFELEARGKLQWFQLSVAFELAARRKVYERGALALAPSLGLGLVLNSGATYMDKDNFSGALLRVTPGLVASYRVADTVAVLGLVDLPLDLGLSSEKARRFQALGGGGVEVYLGSNLSMLVAGQLGVESFRERPGESETRLGWAGKLGLGARLF
ncbi:hypothetical protein JY651_06815 [Pyxidicoccus parkwayensis]|uniref:Outer membrane protein beta-barrel domain-containing protein n=1 Tax=Pyxidicoccus parkwayensis TaxID=2813578 RepID=A0ABX7P1F8_9BACT|nr:hypothetical protein [Pyxidicoccus parkwaysis]QSQ24654.1 hypothetical protein JY651_06815 [Pyxidicoccus parkwaysis]